MRDIYLLGATGSIGEQVLDVVSNNPDKFRVIALSIGNNISKLRTILSNFDVEFVSVANETDKQVLENEYPNIKFTYGEQGLVEVATYGDGGILVNAISGSIGLLPTIEAIKKKRDIAIANKETLVVAGEIVTKLAKEHGVELIPIDSEHSAIMQCFEEVNRENIEKIIITASGGSFRNKTREELRDVTVSDALNHPNWSMGAKITIDSATMMNKGLEVIEAFWLFGLPIEKIETILHYESAVHSMVEYVDGSIVAHIGSSDMRIPIMYALSQPKRLIHKNKKNFNLAKLGSLTFKEMDYERFPCLRMAYDAIKQGGAMPAIMNAANEAAVDLFLKGEIKFLEIESIVEDMMLNTRNVEHPTLEEIIGIDKRVKEDVYRKYR